MLLTSCEDRKKRYEKPKILVFTKTLGIRHTSLPVAKKALIRLGHHNNFDVEFTENAAYFHDDSLGKYSTIVFLNTTDSKDSLLDHYQENAFERYIQAGGGFVGIHAAASSKYQWGWYGRLVGAYLDCFSGEGEAIVKVVDKSHGSTLQVSDSWKIKDEWYTFKQTSDDLNVLLTIDKRLSITDSNCVPKQISWYHDYDGGRAFYTSLGHDDSSYTNENFLNHLLGGIKYAIGKNYILNYHLAKTQIVPNEKQFSKTILNLGELVEPTEMTILPSLDIIIGQRRGEIMLYRKKDRSLKQIGKLDVYHKSDSVDVNAEEGIMGIQADPNFSKNNHLYVFYSPADTSVNRLARFTLINDQIDPSSEKIIIEFYSDRNICCHTGGSIAFGNDYQLFLSTGENATTYERIQDAGYAPLDYRPGHEKYDAGRTAGNSDDLRGKILRLQIRADGTYTIPSGNLFPAGTQNARPEIYVMGNRNPFRISVDKHTGFLYWGDVGPDASHDSPTRGSRGYDEINQARKAGFFGWPFFVGKNFPYIKYDHATGKSGKAYDAAKPSNKSPNNTGLEELPAAQPAFIYYPYDASEEFPQVGWGGRNAMAGPVYNFSDYDSSTAYPYYYNSKLIIYDWVRGWMKAITMRPDGQFDKMEPFLSELKLNSPIDMEVGVDGRIYILEYGTGWYTKNSDAALSRIDYNRGPISETIYASLDSVITTESTIKETKSDLPGKEIMLSSNCRTCHSETEDSRGPSFVRIAERYRNKPNEYLANTIINGSKGVWGNGAMPSHSSMKKKEAILIAEWIKSLAK